MAYIIIVNPNMLSQAGMKWGAVFLATIIASIIGTLVMGLVANVPYAQAPGMGLNAFFVFTVCFTLKFTWQQALSMVFICGVLNILITVTKIRKYIIKSIPHSLQNAIGGGIGVFIAYLGLINVGMINFGSGVPSLSAFNQPALILFIIGLVIMIVLQLLHVKGAILIGIVATTLIGIPMGVTTTADTVKNTTTYVESAAGIGAGGRTDLTIVIVTLCFAASAFLANFVSAVPSAATAPALVIVGMMMISSFAEIKWSDFDEAIPAFFAGIFMALSYSISYGIGTAFIFYCIVKICRKKAKEIHPILAVATLLFILNFILLAFI